MFSLYFQASNFWTRIHTILAIKWLALY